MGTDFLFKEKRKKFILLPLIIEICLSLVKKIARLLSLTLVLQLYVVLCKNPQFSSGKLPLTSENVFNIS